MPRAGACTIAEPQRLAQAISIRQPDSTPIIRRSKPSTTQAKSRTKLVISNPLVIRLASLCNR